MQCKALTFADGRANTSGTRAEEMRMELSRRLAAVALVVLGMSVGIPGADAHDSSMTRNWMSGGRAGFCTQASVQQNHGWHQNSTSATNCNTWINADHAQYEEFYKVPPEQWGQPGTYCFNNGWFTDSNTGGMNRFYGWDIWNWCNNGGWVNVVITIDSWQFAAPPGTGAWIGGALRPATWHCHCP
jgi:hypothetical protein